MSFLVRCMSTFHAIDIFNHTTWGVFTIFNQFSSKFRTAAAVAVHNILKEMLKMTSSNYVDKVIERKSQTLPETVIAGS